jgi:transcriptional regulator with XRE-family HTH domain/mannose-6-phosphate isomerase-like protein (cupin superfamily)
MPPLDVQHQPIGIAQPQTKDWSIAITADIGVRLREARLKRNISLRSVASALGVSASLISQVETGKTQPSVSTLFALSSHLGVSMDELLGVTPPPSTNSLPLPQPLFGHHGSAAPAVQRASENPVLEMENGVRWERLAIGGGGPADGLLVTYGPGGSSSIEGKMMQHVGVEYGYILEGEITMNLDFETYVLGPGDSLQFDSVRPHMFSNQGTVPARGLFFVVGRRQQYAEAPDAPGSHAMPEHDPDSQLTSAVDVLRAIDHLAG